MFCTHPPSLGQRGSPCRLESGPGRGSGRRVGGVVAPPPSFIGAVGLVGPRCPCCPSGGGHPRRCSVSKEGLQMPRHVSKAAGSLHSQEWAELWVMVIGHREEAETGRERGPRGGGAGAQGACGCGIPSLPGRRATFVEVVTVQALPPHGSSGQAKALRGSGETATLGHHGRGRRATRPPLRLAPGRWRATVDEPVPVLAKPHLLWAVSLVPHVAPRKVTVSSALAVT